MNTISKTLLQLAALAALSTGLGLAESAENLTVTVPFDFTVGNTTLPAGAYTIAAAFGSPVMQIRDSRYRVQATVLVTPGDKPADPADSHLVFRVHGNKHYLASTWNATTGRGREMTETHAEREVEMAAGPTTRVVLTARR